MQNLTIWSTKFLEDNPDIETIVLHFLDTYSEEFLNYLNNSIVPHLETLVKQVSVSMINVLSVLWNFIIGLVISIYVLFSKETFAGQGKKITFALFNTKTQIRLSKIPALSAIHLSGLSAGKLLILLL